MAYDDEQSRRSRVVVETPTARREVTHTEAVRNDRGGISGATVGVIVVVAIALITIVVLFLMNGPTTDTVNANVAQQPAPAQQPVIVQQPAAQQPPVIIQQPAPVTQQPPVVITQSAPSGGTSTSSGSQDATIQAAIDKKLADDPALSSLGIIATVLDGKVTITGTVNNGATKSQVERMIRAIPGVKQVDNQIVSMG